MAIKDVFLKNLLKLTSSSVIAQLIVIISSPILTRLYTPEDFGIFALFLSTVTILATLANLRYDQAIIIPKDNEKAKQLVYLCLCVNVLIFIIIFALLYFFSPKLFSIFRLETLQDYYWVLALSVLFIGAFQAFNYWLLRNKKFNTISKIKVQQSIIIVGCQLLFFKVGALCLLLAHTFGQMFGVLKNGYNFLINNRIDFNKMKEVAADYANFPKYSIWSALLNNIGAQLPVFLFTLYFSPAIAGLYLLTQRVIKGPLNIVSQAITQIFLSNLRNEGNNLKRNILKINTLLTMIVIVPLIVIFVAGEQIFSLVFGEQWADAGKVAAVLVPWFFMVFLCSPIGSLLEYKGMQKSYLIFQVSLFLSRVLSITVGVYIFEEYMSTLILFSLVSTLAWMFFLYIVMKVYSISFSTWFMPILKKILIVTGLFLPILLITDINIFHFFLLIIFSSILSIFLIFDKSVFKDEN